MIANLVSAVARGENCFGREKEVDLLWQKLEHGHIVLAAPRRFGKTSVIYRLIDAPRPGFKVIHIDVEHMLEPADLITELFAQLARDSHLAKLLQTVTSLPAKWWSRFRENIQEIAILELKIKLKDEVRPHWQESGEKLFEHVASAKETIVFILDEFPMMVDRMAHKESHREEARNLLRWLRKIRQSQRPPNVRFLLAGSIGIDHVLNELGEIATINDLETMRLEAFPPKVASAFLDALAESEGLPLSAPCKKRMLALVETRIPYFLQVLFSEVAKAHKMENAGVTPRMIERIYRDKVLGVDCKTYFERYFGRLRDYYAPQEEKAAKRILRELAIQGPLSRDVCFQFYKKVFAASADEEEFNRLMTDLENDFYVRFDSETRAFRFACSLLRDWWLRHYAMGAED